MTSNGRNHGIGPRVSGSRRDEREPWAQIYEGVISYVLKHRQEYGADLVRNPLISEGIASILRGLEVLLDGNIGELDDGRCWSNLDSLARFAGWEGGLEDAESGLIEAWLAPVHGEGPIAGNGSGVWIEDEDPRPGRSGASPETPGTGPDDPHPSRSGASAEAPGTGPDEATPPSHDPAATAPQRRLRRQDWA